MSDPECRAQVLILTTRSLDGALRSRPVTIFPGPADGELAVLTTPDARKVREIADCAEISLSGPTATGWWAGEGTATRDVDPERVSRLLAAAGVPGMPAIVLRVSLRGARQWTVHSADPWDNSVVELDPPFLTPLTPCGPG